MIIEYKPRQIILQNKTSELIYPTFRFIPEVEESEGIQLHLSAEAATGYLGVSRHGSGFKVDIGTFATAREAAVAFAKSALSKAVAVLPH